MTTSPWSPIDTQCNPATEERLLTNITDQPMKKWVSLDNFDKAPAQMVERSPRDLQTVLVLMYNQNLKMLPMIKHIRAMRDGRHNLNPLQGPVQASESTFKAAVRVGYDKIGANFSISEMTYLGSMIQPAPKGWKRDQFDAQNFHVLLAQTTQTGFSPCQDSISSVDLIYVKYLKDCVYPQMSPEKRTVTKAAILAAKDLQKLPYYIAA